MPYTSHTRIMIRAARKSSRARLHTDQDDLSSNQLVAERDSSTVRTQHPLPSSFRGPEPWQSSSRSLSRCLRRRTHVNDPGSFSERSVVVYSNDVNAFPSNIFHEKTRSLHSAFAAKNDCATPTGGHVHHCTSKITDHVANR